MVATFPRSVERWRKPLKKLNDWVPLDFLLAWIRVESGGRLSPPVTSLGERGLFQVHPDEVPYLKLSDEQFKNLTKDSGLALRTGVKQAKLYARFSKKYLTEVGSEWHGRDFWKLVKLHHGAFSIPRYTLLAFERENSHGPATWEELETFALDAVTDKKDLVPDDKKFSKRLRALIPKTFKNADKTGAVVPMIGPDEIAAIKRIIPDIMRMIG